VSRYGSAMALRRPRSGASIRLASHARRSRQVDSFDGKNVGNALESISHRPRERSGRTSDNRSACPSGDARGRARRERPLAPEVVRKFEPVVKLEHLMKDGQYDDTETLFG